MRSLSSNPERERGIGCIIFLNALVLDYQPRLEFKFLLVYKRVGLYQACLRVGRMGRQVKL